MDIKKELERFVPFNGQEESDKAIMLETIEKYPDIFSKKA